MKGATCGSLRVQIIVVTGVIGIQVVFRRDVTTSRALWSLRRSLTCLRGQITANFFPRRTAVVRLQHELGAVIKRVGIARRKDQRSFPSDAIVRRWHEQREQLARGTIATKDSAIPANRINEVWVGGIRSDEAALKCAAGEPIAIANLPEVRTKWHYHGTGVLLRRI